MSRRPQATIASTIELAGYGLHSGAPSRIRCLPAPSGSGIVFAPADGPAIPAGLEAVVDTTRGVTVGHQQRVVRTVEHLLAAALALGVANLRVEVDGEELPILDGSALPYLTALAGAGVRVQSAPWDPIIPEEPVWVSRGPSSILLLPAHTFRISYVVPTGIEMLGVQSVDVVDPDAVFAEEIAPARTWGLAAELEQLHAAGLAFGASEENTLGLGPDGYLWPPRFPDEPARHKVLDLIGDLALLGRPLRAHLVAVAAGHTLHVELARRIRERIP